MWYSIYKFAGANLVMPIDIKLRKLLKVFSILGVVEVAGRSKHPKYMNMDTGQTTTIPINHSSEIRGAEIEDALSQIGINKMRFRKVYWSI